MANSLFILPTEILLRIFSLVPLEDRLRVSTLNSKYRALVAPLVFECIGMTNVLANVPVLESLVQKYGGYVKCIFFVGVVAHWGEEEGFVRTTEKRAQEVKARVRKTPTEDLLPEQVENVLKGKGLPKVEAIKVFFDFNFADEPGNDGPSVWGDVGNGRDGLNVFADIEDQKAVERKEELRQWRRLMAQVWNSIAMNKSICELIIPGLILRAVSTYWTSEWANFLSSLTHVNITLRSEGDEAGWFANTLEGYVFFEYQLNEYFFKHMQSVKHLRLEAPSEMPLGLAETDENGINYRLHAPLPFKAEQMPNLVRLELRNVFIDPALVRFLIGKAGSPLTTLELHDAHAASESICATDGITWAEFFAQIRNGGTTLKEFVVAESEPGATILNLDTEDMDDDDRLDHERVCGELRDHMYRVWTYGTCEMKYGDYFTMEDEDFSHLLEGEDQKEYEKLMQLISENAAATPTKTRSMSIF